jgi:hypothetical protein
MASSTDYVFVVGGCLLKRGIVTTRRHKFVSGSIEPRHFRNCKTSKWRQGRQLGISAKSVSRFDPLVYGRICRRKDVGVTSGMDQRGATSARTSSQMCVASRSHRGATRSLFACTLIRLPFQTPATRLLVYEVRGWQVRRAALPHHEREQTTASETMGVIFFIAQRHGFSLSRAKQETFEPADHQYLFDRTSLWLSRGLARPDSP